MSSVIIMKYVFNIHKYLGFNILRLAYFTLCNKIHLVISVSVPVLVQVSFRFHFKILYLSSGLVPVPANISVPVDH